MPLLSVSGEFGCRPEQLARLAAQRLGWDLVTESTLQESLERDFAGRLPIPDRAWPFVAAAVLVQHAAHGPLVFSLPDGQFLLPSLSGLFRLHLTAPESSRLGSVMIDRRLDRTAARALLRQSEAELLRRRRLRFGRLPARPAAADLILNTSTFDLDHQAALLESALAASGARHSDSLSAAAEAQLLFQIRLKLARFGLNPPGHVPAPRPHFGHPSEEIFAKLLDFYRIQWQYEPKSFPLQWDKDGRVTEAFTPDFFLPEFDLYLELTTMKQALVTRKNHKIKLLRAIYPHVNIQVFYQKDIQDLILKYGLPRPGDEPTEL